MKIRRSILTVRSRGRKSSQETVLNFSFAAIRNDEPFNWCYDPHFGNDTAADNESLSCKVLFDGKDANYTENAKTWKPPCWYSDADIERFAEDCDTFKKRFQFPQYPSSREEARFPLAFSMVVEKEAEQVARLLSSLYQPQNLFCLTYDLHASPQFKRAMDSLMRCFPDNMISPKVRREIFWGDFSILEATMDCLQALTYGRPNHRWKYVQIISWNDVPMRTNWEMVKILQIFDGAQDVDLMENFVWRFRNYFFQGEWDNYQKERKRSIPPGNIIMYRGSYAVTLTKEFVKFMFTNPESRALYEWSRSTWAPEEQYWSTVAHNLHLNPPGGFPGSCLHYYTHDNKKKNWISRFQLWQNDPNCKGTFAFYSCVYGAGDLPMLKNMLSLVAHKFYRDFQPAAWYCMHWRNYEKRRHKTTADVNFDFYHDLPAVRYQRLSENEKASFQC